MLITLPPFDRPIWLGYYKIAGRYGDHVLAATLGAANCGVINWGQGDFDLEGGQDPARLLPDALWKLRSIRAALFTNAEAIATVAPFWNDVAGLIVSGEAQGAATVFDTIPMVEDQAARARAQLAALGLPPRPLIGYFDGDVSTGGWRRPQGVDWVALQCYIGPTAPLTAQEAFERLWARISSQIRTVAPVPVLLAAQAYDRNGAWVNEELLAGLQPIYADAVRSFPAVRGVLWFSYSRPGGVIDHPALRPWHEAIFRATPRTPRIEGARLTWWRLLVRAWAAWRRWLGW